MNRAKLIFVTVCCAAVLVGLYCALSGHPALAVMLAGPGVGGLFVAGTG